MLVILALGVLLLAPAARLPSKISGSAGELFELPETLESMDPASELQAQLEIIHGPHQPAEPFRLARTITPGSMGKTRHLEGLGAKVRAEGVLVESSEAAHRELDIHKEPFSQLNNWWEDEGHGRSLSQKADY